MSSREPKFRDLEWDGAVEDFKRRLKYAVAIALCIALWYGLFQGLFIAYGYVYAVERGWLISLLMTLTGAAWWAGVFVIMLSVEDWGW